MGRGSKLPKILSTWFVNGPFLFSTCSNRLDLNAYNYTVSFKIRGSVTKKNYKFNPKKFNTRW